METSLKTLVKALLPELPHTKFMNCVLEEQTLTLNLKGTTKKGRCPACNCPSHRVRSLYWRTVWDLPWADKSLRIRILLRKFACDQTQCPRRIFSERLPTLPPYARCTLRRVACQVKLGMALGGEAGARLSREMHLTTSPATLLRRVRQVPIPSPATPKVVGVDDWAFRKGERYGTLLIDLETHRPIDLLPSRTSQSLISWLQQHPQIEVISRDRSTEYARAASEGVPQALQVADRFHLVANLRETLQNLVERNHSHRSGIVLPSRLYPPEATRETLPIRLPERRSPLEEAQRQASQQKRRQRYEQVHALRAEGGSITEIARTLHLHRSSVYRDLRRDITSAVQRHHPSRSGLEPHLAYLLQRWADGCHNAMQLWREIVSQGYPGTHKMVHVWAQQQRSQPAPETISAYRSSAVSETRRGSRLPSPRAVAFFLIRRPDKLSPLGKQVLVQIQEASPEVAKGYSLFQEFVGLLRSKDIPGFSYWMESVRTSGLIEFQNFVIGLERDRDAVYAAVSQPWSNGQTEGHVTRLKYLKRQMYGRANFDLLRQRVLHG